MKNVAVRLIPDTDIDRQGLLATVQRAEIRPPIPDQQGQQALDEVHDLARRYAERNVQL
ncbi:hypothetical protein GOB93_19405 [Acetobacter musti]|uniref:Uncharacterized protein n=1 Tax=Acetobacter musti TaxID=864732 RepID=A0ABX0JTE1_9PROT|nr:hypothetical protein [Acetobacter musti]NHN86768.1 hypothetical protein [Acetobacter musti]